MAVWNCDPLLDLIFNNDVNDTALIEQCKLKTMSIAGATGFNYWSDSSELVCTIMKCDVSTPSIVNASFWEFYHRTGVYNVSGNGASYMYITVYCA